MISNNLLANLSPHGRLTLLCGLLILGGLALLAAMLYVATRALRIAYTQQEQITSRCRLTGREAVGRLLEHLGLAFVCIDDGAKIDHYDQLRRRVRLRTESSVSSSVAALAIAAHEVGHAEQFAKGYWAARATRCLLVLLVFGAAVLLVYPFATTILYSGEVNLTRLLALGALVALVRMPVALALELDANRRAKRLLDETRLAYETEREGIAHFLRAAFLTHVVLSLAIVLLIGTGVAVMWLVESALSAPALTGMEVDLDSTLEPIERLPRTHAINPADIYAYPIAAFTLAVATVWWAFSGRTRKGLVRTMAKGVMDSSPSG